MGARLPDPQPPAPPDRVVEAVLDLWRAGQKAHAIPIRGRSMLPALVEGDVVRVVHTVDHLVPGVIVVFRQDRELIAHRVLRVRQARPGGRIYLTQGDNCRYPDSALETGAIVGQVVGLWRQGRYRPLDGWRHRGVGWLIAQGQLLKARLRRRPRPSADGS